MLWSRKPKNFRYTWLRFEFRDFFHFLLYHLIVSLNEMYMLGHQGDQTNSESSNDETHTGITACGSEDVCKRKTTKYLKTTKNFSLTTPRLLEMRGLHKNSFTKDFNLKRSADRSLPLISSVINYFVRRCSRVEINFGLLIYWFIYLPELNGLSWLSRLYTSLCLRIDCWRKKQLPDSGINFFMLIWGKTAEVPL